MVLASVGVALVAASCRGAGEDTGLVQGANQNDEGFWQHLHAGRPGGNMPLRWAKTASLSWTTSSPPLAEKIQAALKELKITDKPVRFVINTR